MVYFVELDPCSRSVALEGSNTRSRPSTLCPLLVLFTAKETLPPLALRFLLPPGKDEPPGKFVGNGGGRFEPETTGVQFNRHLKFKVWFKAQFKD